MKNSLRIRAAARRDIHDAALWYETQRRGLGTQFLREIDRVLRRVGEAPLQFPEIAPGVRRGLARRFPFAVYFMPIEAEVTILAVLHMRRHPASWRARD